MGFEEIGDGGYPNKYWVGWSNDYYIEEDSLEWASEIEGFEVWGETSRSFKTYKEAMDFFNSISLSEDLDDDKAIRVKSIEDRLSGQLTEEAVVVKKNIDYFFNEDLSFTKDKMRERGETFK